MIVQKSETGGSGPALRVRVRRQLFGAAVFACATAAGAAEQARPSVSERTGKEIVDSVCASCHASGTHKAPRIGDKQAWEKLSARGLTSLTESALKGVRQMPSHGGRASLTDDEIRRAITYMVNQSGGHWVEPVSRGTPSAERSGQEIVQAYCAKCHRNGDGGAPKIGDGDAWRPRLKHGLDSVVRSAIHGHGGMAPRGGVASLTDSEIRAAIVYMFNPGGGGTKAR